MISPAGAKIHRFQLQGFKKEKGRDKDFDREDKDGSSRGEKGGPDGLRPERASTVRLEAGATDTQGKAEDEQDQQCDRTNHGRSPFGRRLFPATTAG